MDLVEVAFNIVRDSKLSPEAATYSAKYEPAMIEAAEIFLVTQFENQIEAQKIQLDAVKASANSTAHLPAPKKLLS